MDLCFYYVETLTQYSEIVPIVNERVLINYISETEPR